MSAWSRTRDFLARHRKAEVAVAEAAGMGLAKKLATLAATGAATTAVALTGTHVLGSSSHGGTPVPPCARP